MMLDEILSKFKIKPTSSNMVFKRGQQHDANTKESKDTVLESDDFPLRRSPLLFDNNL